MQFLIARDMLSPTKSLTFDLTDTDGPVGDVEKKHCRNKNTGKIMKRNEKEKRKRKIKRKET